MTSRPPCNPPCCSPAGRGAGLARLGAHRVGQDGGVRPGRRAHPDARRRVAARPALPIALAIAPTRELALQVQAELAWLYAGARIASCVGGMDIRREARALAAGCHIVVGTPGRLGDHLRRGNLDLSALQVVVLDEADEMLDLGFAGGAAVHPRTRRRPSGGRCCSPPPSRTTSPTWPGATSRTRCGSTRSTARRRIPTSSTAPSRCRRTRRRRRWSTCCAGTRPRGRWCSARRGRAPSGCTWRWWSAASPP